MVRDAIGNVLRARAADTPERICCAMDDDVFTYAQMDQRSDALAAGVRSLGIEQGDRIATLSPNRPELLELFYGLAKTGAAQVPLNAFIKGEFLRHQLGQSRASVLITDAAGRDAVNHIKDELPELRQLIMLDEPQPGQIPYAELFE